MINMQSLMTVFSLRIVCWAKGPPQNKRLPHCCLSPCIQPLPSVRGHLTKVVDDKKSQLTSMTIWWPLVARDPARTDLEGKTVLLPLLPS